MLRSQDFRSEEVTVVWYRYIGLKHSVPRVVQEGRTMRMPASLFPSLTPSSFSSTHKFLLNLPWYHDKLSSSGQHQDLEEVWMDGNKGSSFCGGTTPVSCPPGGRRCTLCRAWHPALLRQSPSALGMVPARRSCSGWASPSSSLCVAFLLPEPMLSPSLTAAWSRLISTPSLGSSSRAPSPLPPPPAGWRVWTSRVVRMCY